MKNSPMPARKKQMPRGAGPKRKTWMSSGSGAERRKATTKRKTAKDTGPSRAVRALVRKRDLETCVVCGVIVAGRPSNVHHRRNRGIGGSSDPRINAVENLITACGTPTTGCHGILTLRPWEIDAEVNGWVVSTNGVVDPAEVLVLVAWLGWCLPTPDGQWRVIEDAGEVAW